MGDLSSMEWLRPRVCVCVYMQLFGWVGDTRRHYTCLAVVFGLMSVEGWTNLQHQWNIAGEYQNVPTEQLMNWINDNASPRLYHECLLTVVTF